MTDISRRKFLSLAPASVGAIALGGVAYMTTRRPGSELVADVVYVNKTPKKIRELNFSFSDDQAYTLTVDESVKRMLTAPLDRHADGRPFMTATEVLHRKEEFVRAVLAVRVA